MVASLQQQTELVFSCKHKLYVLRIQKENMGEGFVKNSSSTLESGHCCNGGLLVILYLTEGCAC